MELKKFIVRLFICISIAEIGVIEACLSKRPTEQIHTPTSTTFRACDQTPLDAPFENHSGSLLRWSRIKLENDSIKIVENLPAYFHHSLTEVLRSTKFPSQSVTFSNNPGFVTTVVESYSNHFNLVIRPDDIWAAIMTQFSFYLNKNAEKYRSKFVTFEGQRNLVLETVGTLRTVSYSWFVNAMTDEIDKNLVDPQVKNWVLPNFSTTTENDKVTVGVVFMAVMKKYFTYAISMGCGIPWITLDGTTQDWQNILGRLEKLKEYDLQPWYELLHPIITKFVDARQGRIDQRFWRTIVDRREEGSGVDYISGWITAFCVFDVEGNWQPAFRQGRGETPLQRWLKSNQTNAALASRGNELTWLSYPEQWPQVDMGDIASGIVEVDVKINDNGEEYKSLMLAGHMAAEVLERNGLTLKPALGWAIALKP
ncbi:unnamed protein product [Orchesella dallaii]|uniref:Uncharacterized protein n=1 Tax=Orchesella dallaii TaxID=48710 RepID=A0ABP1S536_9HEXA